MPEQGPRRITFAYFPQEPEPGAEFEVWPQHMVLFPPIPESDPQTARILASRAANSSYEFPITMGAFNVLEGQPVRELKKHSAGVAKALHAKIAEGLISQNIDLSAVNHYGDDYLPHISMREGYPELAEGQQFMVNHIALVTTQPFRGDFPVTPQRIDKIYNLKPRE